MNLKFVSGYLRRGIVVLNRWVDWYLAIIERLVCGRSNLSRERENRTPFSGKVIWQVGAERGSISLVIRPLYVSRIQRVLVGSHQLKFSVVYLTLKHGRGRLWCRYPFVHLRKGEVPRCGEGISVRECIQPTDNYSRAKLWISFNPWCERMIDAFRSQGARVVVWWYSCWNFRREGDPFTFICAWRIGTKLFITITRETVFHRGSRFTQMVWCDWRIHQGLHFVNVGSRLRNRCVWYLHRFRSFAKTK